MPNVILDKVDKNTLCSQLLKYLQELGQLVVWIFRVTRNKELIFSGLTVVTIITKVHTVYGYCPTAPCSGL